VRTFVRIPLAETLALATEVELARPDDRSRGGFWPWALAALSWRPAAGWETAIAVEAYASPELEHAIDALFRASYAWSTR
jgi:hypothetical protein